MANYNKSVNFAVKDTLQSGDPNKIVSGVEIDTEFNNISSASTTKIDKVPAAVTDNLASFTASGAIKDSGKDVTDFADVSVEADVSTLQTNKANKVSGATSGNFAQLDSDGDLVDSGENETTIINISSPTGAITAFAADSAPTGWLECDGSAVSRTTYANLFSVIGTTFGVGDASTTFNLPDLRGEFIRGWDDGRGADSGRSFGSDQLDQMQRITGSIGEILADTPVSASGAIDFVGKNSPNFDGANESSGTNGTFSFDSANSPNARTSSTTNGETRPRNVALLYIIKT